MTTNLKETQQDGTSANKNGSVEEENGASRLESRSPESTASAPGDAGRSSIALNHADSAERRNPPQMGRILSMKVPLIVKIAQKRMNISDILKFNLGSIIQFEQNSAQQIDLMVNNTTIGLGQAAKVGENFGLKINQIGDIATTIKALGK